MIKQAFYDGKDIFVYADETRPRFQGARLTAWELVQAGIPAKLIPDSAAATLIRDGKVDLVMLGGDRVAANGDVANKLGTFALRSSARSTEYRSIASCRSRRSTFRSRAASRYRSRNEIRKK